MAEIGRLWHYEAILKALKALTEFEKTGSRRGFKEWQKEYSEKIEKERSR